MSKNITFITGNAGKAEQLSKYLGIPILHKKLDLPEVQSLDLSEVVEYKAREAYRILKKPVIVDDVALTIHSLGRLPGPFIKYFISELSNKGICDLAFHNKNKSATAVVAIGYCDGAKCKIFTGEIKGKIASAPSGEGGFGWDAIFIPDGYKETRASMSEQDYDKTSPRRIALAKLEAYLKRLK